MNAPEWFALSGLAFTLLSTIAVVAYRLGQHSQRITTLEEKTKDISHTASAIAVMTSTLGRLDKGLESLAMDVRGLLTDKPTRQRPER